MKVTIKSFISFFMILALIFALLPSCKQENNNETTHKFSLHNQYVSKIIDLGLSKNEAIMEVMERDNELQITIGVTSKEREEIYTTREGIPYLTEYRYYTTSFSEDKSKRKSTVSSHEVAILGSSDIDLVLGGEPFLGITDAGNTYYQGVQYFFHRDGISLKKNIVPPLPDWSGDDSTRSVLYEANAHIMLCDNAIYAGIKYSQLDPWNLYINDHMVTMPEWNPLIPEYELCGLIGIAGVPYALVRVWEKNYSEQIVDTIWEETRLVPLTPDTTELPLEGTKIDGKATGGAFSDGEYGYFFCGSELWRTDGKESKCIADLIFCGVNEFSRICSLRRLSDGRLLVVADGKLIELTGTDGTSDDEKEVFTIGVVNLYGDISNLSIALSKFNGISENAVFKLKEFSDQASLNMAILSGEVSMVVSRDQFLLKNYIKQDILVPLDRVAPEFFEKDVLIENIVDATKVNGICYYLPRYFAICGEQTDVRLLEEEQTFETRQDYFDFLSEKDPDYVKARTKSAVFTTFGQDLDEWIDWGNNTCHFDDGSFRDLLEFCNQANTTQEGTYLFDGTLITQNFVLSDSVESNRFTDVAEAKAYWDQLSRTEPQADEYIPERVWVKYPIPSAAYDGYEIYAPYFFAVVDHQASLEAAGDLLRWHFLEDVIDEFPSQTNDIYMDTFSINRDETDRFLSRNIDGYMDTAPDPSLISSDVIAYDVMVKTMHNMKCGPEQYEKTWEYIRAGDHFQYFRNELFDVIYQEANRFFHNAITAEQAAEYVQNRVSLYLAEQG